MYIVNAPDLVPKRTSRHVLEPLRGLFVLCAIGMTAGCANLQTIGRTTNFPESTTGGTAIHLDAQQRLVITTGQKYCAEPSPDALASYASALGFGITGANKDSASAAYAMQSNAGSIGLRTQSITLMRDALYRMCEAQANGAISGSDAATFLTRSQDLIAVVLAIEQLTGAVAASPVLLTGSASANASALLLSNQQMLEQAKKAEAAAKESVDKATEIDTAAKAQVTAKEAELVTARANEATVAGSATATVAEKAEAKAQADAVADEVDEAKNAAEAAAAELTDAKQSLADAKQNRETIEAQRNSSLVTASSHVSGSGQFGTTVQRQQLSVGATKAVAAAVSGMVAAVLGKSYTTETCMAFLTKSAGNTPIDKATADSMQKLVTACTDMISAELKKRSSELDLQTEELKAATSRARQ